MTFETRFTWEKLVLELKLLRNEDFDHLVPICIGIQSLLWPKETVENSFRQIQFMGFEIQKACEGQAECERWESLRKFLFEEKGFQVCAGSQAEMGAHQILVKSVLEERMSHPLTLVLLFLHLAHYLDLPMALLQARHHYLLKWVRSGKTFYLDIYNEGRALTDQEIIQVLNRSSSNLEVWSAKQLLGQYLELLLHAFERSQSLTQLHVVYNLILLLDETNISVLGQRALLRQRLGYQRDALCDLKRYFSFVEHNQAPAELQQAFLELENTGDVPPPAPKVTEFLH